LGRGRHCLRIRFRKVWGRDQNLMAERHAR
jgi:hypothetical protein